ncbi:hypothetical protein BJV77DRAFT_253601 [Russula vinacea]|nr:hypothetical protein BJV77DRAFT_253601 [Russula vinacea]
MSDRIVSWRINDSEPRVSPSLSTVSSTSGLSVLSINSIGTDTHMMTTEATGAQHVDLGATKLTNLIRNANPTSKDSFVRHDIYFFNDGNITFLVDGTLYCVHRYFFCRDSAYFSTKLVQLDVRDHQPLNTIISLGDIERKDFEAFLSVIYPENFEEHGLSYEQWKSVLHLSTRWGFASLRNLALNSIKPPTAFDRLLLARTYSVDHWVLPALSALCKRKRPTSLKEAHQMRIEDIVVVATVREEIRSQKTFVDTAGLERQIEAAQVKVVAHVANDDETAEEELPNVAVTKDDTKEVASAVPPSAVDMHRGNEHPVVAARIHRQSYRRRNQRRRKRRESLRERRKDVT